MTARDVRALEAVDERLLRHLVRDVHVDQAETPGDGVDELDPTAADARAEPMPGGGAMESRALCRTMPAPRSCGARTFPVHSWFASSWMTRGPKGSRSTTPSCSRNARMR